MNLRCGGRLIACLVGLVFAAGATRAQPIYPNKPVRIISDSAPGSGIDVALRIIVDGLSQHWNQQVIVINQPGGGRAIAAKAAADATAGGYTLYAPASSAFLTVPGKLWVPLAEAPCSQGSLAPCRAVASAGPNAIPCRSRRRETNAQMHARLLRRMSIAKIRWINGQHDKAEGLAVVRPAPCRGPGRMSAYPANSSRIAAFSGIPGGAIPTFVPEPRDRTPPLCTRWVRGLAG
jgi:hypothetical protein